MNHELAAVRQILADLKLQAGGEHPCPYLGNGTAQGLLAREEGFFAERLPAGFYHGLLDLGFRRSGKLLYRPRCRGCAECLQIRVPVGRVELNRTQRRCLKHNAELTVTVDRPRPDAERHKLYRRYLAQRHGEGGMSDDYQGFVGFLYDSCVETREAVFRLDGRLVMVSILDREPLAVSAVYCYFDPELPARSLGLYNMLWSLSYCRAEAVPWYYLGYYIAGCRKMNYKTRLQPCEVLDAGGNWSPGPTRTAGEVENVP
ncbi:MAG: arginyltransferase [Planctomycetota bacterium]